MSVKFLTGQGVDGDVGIGTNSPSAKLDVRTANGNTQSLRIGRLDAASYWDFNHAGNDLRIYNNGGTGQDILLGVNGGGTIYDNKVGIGTATPQSILNINGGTGSLSTGLTFGDGDTGIWEASDDNLRFSTASSTRMIIVSSGNVGIGTTSPSAKLEVSNNGSNGTVNENLLVNMPSASNYVSGTGSTIGFKGLSQYFGALGGYTNGIPGLGFWSGTNTGAPSMVLIGGNVGIGTTSPLGKLQVGEYTVASQGNQNMHGEVSIFANSGNESLFLGIKNAAYPNRGWAFNPITNGVNSDLQIKEHGATGVRMTIQTSGNVGIGNTSPGYKLEVTGNARVSTNFYIGNVDAVTTATEVLVRQSDRVRGITPANLIDSISAPVTPGSITSTIVGETIEISFNESTTSNIDYYQVWSSDDGGDFGIIAQITPTDFSSTMTVVDTTFVTGGTMSYRVYAVKSGVYSSPGTTSISYTVGVLNVTNMSVVNLNTAYYIQYEKPLSRFIDHIEIYMDSQTTSAALNRSNASIVYSGQNPSYMRDIGVSSNFHQFWVEVVTT